MPAKPPPRNPDFVDINDRQEIAYWCNLFDCTEDDLRYCVKFSGEKPDAVRRCINAKNGRT